MLVVITETQIMNGCSITESMNHLITNINTRFTQSLISIDYWNNEYLKERICLEWLLKYKIRNDYMITK
jgi:hypothetical protein